MKIKTKFFGEVEVESTDFITFKEPILGFEDDREFILIDIVELDSLKCLQSVSKEELCFIVSDPWVYFGDYNFDITDETSDILEVKTDDDIEVYNILTIKDTLETSTINLSAPIILNHKNNFASQIIIESGIYHSSHSVK